MALTAACCWCAYGRRIALRGLVVDGARFTWAQGKAQYLRARGLAPPASSTSDPLLGGKNPSKRLASAAAGGKGSQASVGPQAAVTSIGDIVERRDASMHSSKQKIVVVSKLQVAAANDDDDNDDDDELVE